MSLVGLKKRFLAHFIVAAGACQAVRLSAIPKGLKLQFRISRMKPETGQPDKPFLRR